MRFLSLFSGIEAASCAWLPLGWECVAVAEIEKFPCSVLNHHYPDVPNLGDITKITSEQIKALGHIDLVVGGFPCQDLSVAGKRKGLKNDDGSNTRSGLFFDAMRVVRWSGARFLLLENVPGIYSSNRGGDFASVVTEILGVGFDVPDDGWQNTGVAASENGLLEWTTLDAQWFGVPQRRRRMFALADFGEWASRPPVLFERHSLSGDTPPSRQAGKEVTGPIMARTTAGGGFGGDFETAGGLQVVGSLCADSHPGGYSGQDAYTGRLIAHSLRGEGFDASEDGTGRGTPLAVVPTLTSNGDAHSGYRDEHGLIPVPIQSATIVAAFKGGQGSKAGGIGYNTITAPTLGAADSGSNRAPALMQAMRVRRLTPKECARLQGFPDNYLDITFNGKPACDGPKYKALGNSMAIPCMSWIGSRIDTAHQITSIQKQVAA